MFNIIIYVSFFLNVGTHVKFYVTFSFSLAWKIGMFSEQWHEMFSFACLIRCPTFLYFVAKRKYINLNFKSIFLYKNIVVSTHIINRFYAGFCGSLVQTLCIISGTSHENVLLVKICWHFCCHWFWQEPTIINYFLITV